MSPQNISRLASPSPSSTSGGNSGVMTTSYDAPDTRYR
jgi:hypothetical protein